MMRADSMKFVVLILTLLRASSFLISQGRRNSMVRRNIRDDSDLIIEKALDTAEDIFLIVGRSLSSHRKIESESDQRQRVVVVGSGWSAHAFLKVVDTEKYRVTCISPRPFFVFTPMLASTALGAVEYRSIIEPIRSSNPFVEYIEAEVVNIDPSKKSLTVQTSLKFNDGKSLDPFNVLYDYLVFSPGAKVNDFGLDGVYRHCYFVKEIEDVKRLKKTIFDSFEFASLPPNSDSKQQNLLTFVVIGGGPTGVEFTAELCDFVQYDVAKLYPTLFNKVEIILLNSGTSVLSAFDVALQRKAIGSLRERGIDVRLNSRVTAVERDRVIYETTGDAGVEQVELPCNMCIWAAGNAARDITKTLAAAPLLADSQFEFLAKHGRLDVDPWLRLRGFPREPGRDNTNDYVGSSLAGSILVAGDCAGAQYLHNNEMVREALVKAEAEASGEQEAKSTAAIRDGQAVVAVAERQHRSSERRIELLPQTAQVAGQQGAYLARLLNRQYNLAEPVPVLSGRSWMTNVTRAMRVRGALNARPFRFLNLGLLTYVGNQEALAQVQIGDLDVLKSSGENAFLLWRSVYVVKQVSLRSRVLVLFDFLKSKLFGRDLTSV